MLKDRKAKDPAIWRLRVFCFVGCGIFARMACLGPPGPSIDIHCPNLVHKSGERTIFG